MSSPVSDPAAPSDMVLRERARLPVFPPGLPYLLRELGDEDLPYERMAEVLERFPSIVARLIALANSAWSSPVAPIDSLENACARLGFNVVRSVSVALAVAAPFQPERCQGFDIVRFWSSALLCADVANWVASRARLEHTQAARTAGLLHNIGLVWLADQYPDQVQLAITESQQQQSTLNTLLIEHCGMGYDEAGGKIAALLELPPSLREAIAEHRRAAETDFQGSQLACAVGLAQRQVSKLLRDDYPSDINPGSCHLDENDMQVIEKMAQRSLPRIHDLAGSLFG